MGIASLITPTIEKDRYNYGYSSKSEVATWKNLASISYQRGAAKRATANTENVNVGLATSRITKHGYTIAGLIQQAHSESDNIRSYSIIL